MNSTGTSNSSGVVLTIVKAGIVNTPVRVTATVRGTTISALSDQLVVSTGIPDQDSFTVSPTELNIECGNYDGVHTDFVTAFVADHFNNPVPDGTAVSLTTEGGAIDASCLTGLKETTLTDGTKILQKGLPGQCSVRFICQSPRPGDGRSTVLAYALGEESFVDDPTIAGSINRFDAGETYRDLREPFRFDRAITNADAMAPSLADQRFNDAYLPFFGVSPAPGEPYIDSDGSGFWNSVGDGAYNGVLQATPNSATRAIHVRDSFVLVFSGSTAEVTPVDIATLSALNPGTPLQLDRCVDGVPFSNLGRTVNLSIRDQNQTVFSGNGTLAGNVLPAGTTIEFSASNGRILTGTEVVVPSTNDPSWRAWTYPVLIQSDATQSGPGTVSNGVTNPAYVCDNAVTSGLLTVTVTTPRGVVTTATFAILD